MPNKMHRVNISNSNHAVVGFVKATFWKLFAKITEHHYKDKNAYLNWLKSLEQPFEVYASERSPNLLQEAIDYEQWLYAYAREERAKIPVQLGGNAYVRLVYFLARWKRPEVFVETGVASGYSSRAVLDALTKNGGGRLYSSDLPYLTRRGAHRYIGHLVDTNSRKNWILLLQGDRVNLPKISDAVDRIDILHYDSDKSKIGRRFAADCILSKMSPGGILVFDDINDNDFFLEFSSELRKPFFILNTPHKHVGLIEL
jgi:predicted O-methyltransferase YrrM